MGVLFTQVCSLPEDHHCTTVTLREGLEFWQRYLTAHNTLALIHTPHATTRHARASLATTDVQDTQTWVAFLSCEDLVRDEEVNWMWLVPVPAQVAFVLDGTPHVRLCLFPWLVG